MKNLTLIIICLLLPLLINAGDESVVHGTEIDDVLIGTDNIDTIYGGEGNDRIESGKGSDTLYGGPGSDIFVVKIDESGAYDTVMDFSPIEGDKILIDISKNKEERKKYHIPKRLTYRNVSLDRKGHVSIKLTNGVDQTFLNIKQSDLKIEVEDKGRSVHVKFSKKF